MDDRLGVQSCFVPPGNSIGMKLSGFIQVCMRFRPNGGCYAVEMS